MHLPGTCLNHYRIVRQLGAGGMGEVYEAEDTRLKRRIALKVLPPETSSDPVRRARFQQEAEAVAALNHPNIVTIHSIEDAGNIPFLTMEMVDGCTLDRLVPADGLPLQDLLKYAIPIVDALSAAHERGIVHRDLKPANVMVANDGRLKVLDFGIARLLNAAAADASAPTSTGSAGITAFGAFAGTPAYMSPEQAEGRPVDHRSDIFSVGVLLYEMATGVRPFSGDTNLSILSSIVRDEPAPMSAVRKGIPRPLERIVADCLAKDPSKRLASAKLLRARLEALADGGGARSGTRRIAGATLAVVLAAGAFYIARHSTTRADVNPGVPAFARVTYEPGIKMSPSLSPDGRDVAYAFQPPSKPPHIVVRRLDGSVAPIDLSRGSSGSDDTPVFSPDGRSIAFASTRDNSAGIFIMDRDGDNARRLINGGFDPSWTPDGSELVYSTESGQDPDGREAPSELWIVNVSTGQKRRLARIDAVDPAVSPDGRFVAFWGLPVNVSGDQFADANRDVWVQPMAGGAPVRITDSDSSDWNPAWSSDSRFLYFSSDRSGAMNIWRVPVDAATGRPAGAPIAITAPSSYVSQMTVGRDGTVAYTAFDFDTSVRAIAFDPVGGGVEGPARDVVTGHRSWLQPDVSPDGRLVALRSFRGQEDVWVVGADGTGLRPVTHDPARDRGARWAPDGSLFFYSSRNHGYQFWTVQADGSGARQLTSGDWALNYPLPSPDGRRVAATNPNSNEQLIFDARDWSRAPERLPASPGRGQTYLRDWSPDGTRLAAADVSSTLWVFDLAARTWDRVGTGSYPRWLPDGERMLAVSRGRITLLDTRTKTARDIYGEPGRYIGSLALTADGRQLYFTSAITQADIWTMRFAR